jgi:hypothetical protein
MIVNGPYLVERQAGGQILLTPLRALEVERGGRRPAYVRESYSAPARSSSSVHTELAK